MNDEHLQAIDELATVFDQKQAAHDLLDRIGFPVSRRPVFDPDPRSFWRPVYRAVQKGLTDGGTKALLQQAHLLFPENPVFKHLAAAEDPSIPRLRVWNVPHRRNLVFTGRDDILKALHAALTDDSRAAIGQAIRGLGGIGKTQTAVEYAYRYRDQYETVLWTRAETETELVAGFAQLAHELGLPEKDAAEQALAVEAVRRWLAQHDSWLLVLDNADTPVIVEPFLPTDPRGHLLMTSRAPNFDALDFEALRLPTLPPEEALAFLLQRAHRPEGVAEEREAAAELVSELGYLPLALEQAAAYIAARQTRVDDYLKSYRRQHLAMLAKGQPRPDHPEPVATTWALNFEQVEQSSEAAADVLRCCAFLAPDRVPLELLVDGAPKLGPSLAAALDAISSSP